MKTFRKLSAAIIAALIALSMLSPAFAAENEQPEAQSDEIVATVSLCSCIYFWPVSGHTWIYVENLSDETQRVGLYDVPPEQGVSIGSFAFTSRDGWGLYYNLEAYRENRDNNMQNHWVKKKSLTQAELDRLSDKIAGYTNSWGFYRNCAFFSFSIWNYASGDFLVPLVIPGISQLQVIIAGAEKGVNDMYSPTPDQVCRQHGSGENATLAPVSDKTLNA